MAEEFQKYKRFEYRTNSNLVLQREGAAPSQNEPTGEPESLRGRIPFKMGDLAKMTKTNLTELKNKKRSDVIESRKKRGDAKRQKVDTRGETVLSKEVTELRVYKPKTASSRAAFGQLLSVLQTQLGDQSPEVLQGAADEILMAIKTDGVTDAMRKKNVEEVLGPIPDTYFGEIYRHSKDITDFGADIEEQEEGKGTEGIADATGVAVVFDEEDEPGPDDRWLGEIESSDGEDADEKMDLDLGGDRGIHVTHHEDLKDDRGTTKNKYEVDISKIDAHWLQRELSKFTQDPNKCVALEKEILSVLPIGDLQQCENKLVHLLDYKNFEFTKVLLQNRLKVLYCTRLGQAQSVEERAQMLDDMKKNPEAADVLTELEMSTHKRDKEKDVTRELREEARALQRRQAQLEAQKEDRIQESGNQEALKKPSHMLDLDALAFAQGGHFMSNSKCLLPEGTVRVTKPHCEEVHITPPAPPHIESEDLIDIGSMPPWTHAIFPDTKRLNPVQSKVYNTAFNEYNENMLICAPTGAGKTNCAMLTILNVLKQYRLEDNTFDRNAFKIVYIAPMKALVQEVVQSFSIRLKPFNIVVKELSGDSNLTKAEIDETQIIVTTPEKWDIITRKSGDQRSYTQLVRLIIMDEIHLLHDTRGPVLEALVARTIRQIQQSQEFVRLVGLSATLPNYVDVATFLRVKMDKGLYFFDNKFRPVPLEQTFIGVTDKKAIKRLNTMNEVCFEKLVENAGKSQVLIFVHSRKETAKTAKALRDMATDKDMIGKFLGEDSASREILESEVEHVKTQDVKDLLPYGFAIHHAGLPRTDRKLIEDLFADKHIQVLVSTSTLAWGVNLPAQTVIIKGTQVYKPEKGQWDELSPMDMLQMLGRAGRPQYDKTGHGIVITQHSELQYYLSLLNQQLPIESQMLSCLPDTLNAELVLGTIQSRADAVDWLGYTYLYLRMLRNPRIYGIQAEELDEDHTLEQRRIDLVHSAFILLDKHNLIKYDKRTGNIQVTPLGRVASHYYIKHPSIAIFNENLKPTMSDIEFLRLFSLSHEFKYIPVREEEKIELQKLVERVPVPVKGGAEESTSKINVLLQAYISRLKLEGFALVSDMVYVQQSAGRIMRAIFEICLRRNWASLALRALTWCKMVDKKMWSSQTPLRHFKGVNVNEDILKKVEKKDLSWERLYDLSSNDVGELIRFPKMGKTIHKLIHQFPKLDLSAYVQPITRSCLMVELTITPDFQWEQKFHSRTEPFWIFVEDVNSEQILHYELFLLKESGAEEEHTLNFTVPISEPLPPQYFIRVISDKWIAAETLLPVSFRHLILPEKYQPHTELLDLQPLPVTALRYEEAEVALYSELKTFNPLQTQTFDALYTKDENVLVCATAASGKILCAEFAILHMLKTVENPRCVYVAPHEETCKERFEEWKERFGRGMGVKIAELTGENATDVKLLEDNHIVISTPDRWDLLSRRWKTRKSVQHVKLFLVDEIHLLDGEVGPTLEAVVSRMRYISVQIHQPIRIVAMGASVANAKDLAEWIGAGPSGMFNFSPNVRTVPLEMIIQGFDVHQRTMRLLAMARPVYHSIKNYSADKPVIVFVPDRKQCRMTAIDLLLQAASDNMPKRFLKISDEAMQPHVNNAREKTLKQTLEFGVGFMHEGFSSQERASVERLFLAGAIQVLVVTQQLCWGMTLSAHLVVIMDTKYFDGKENRYVDYPIADMLQMMGRASRPGIDQSGMCALLCQTSKKEFYKKFIYEPLPVESHLDQRLADHLNAEIVMKTIENKQDAVDWLTWSFYYRRLSQNPNYYGIQGVTHQHLSDHLSETVENTIDALEQAGCADVEDEVTLMPANLGLISAFYYLKYTTVETFSRSVQATTKRKGLLEILCAASEFDLVPVRAEEENLLRTLAAQLDITIPDRTMANEPHKKAHLLLEAHFQRWPLSTDLASDQKFVLEHVVRLIQGLVDVIASSSWLAPALMAMELSQMTVQAVPANANQLLQLPHFTPQLCEECKEMGVMDVFGLMNMDDEPRSKLFKNLPPAHLIDIANAANRYPSINLEHKISNEKELTCGDTATVVVKLEREGDDNPGPVYSPYFLKEKEESYWLVMGTAKPKDKDKENKDKDKQKKQELVAIKRIAFNKSKMNVKLQFDVGEFPGEKRYVLYLISDSYQGCDQEYSIKLKVKEN